MATEEQARRLVDVLATELTTRSIDVLKHDRYYRGKHPLRFASDEFRKYCADRYAGFSDNWTQPVADSPVERLTVTGVQVPGEVKADADLWGVWQRNGLDADSQLGFLGAGNAARCFVLVWGDPDDEDTPCVTFEDASSAIVQYEPGSRRRRRAAMKMWQDGFSEYATLYLKDEVWKFERPLSAGDKKSPQMAEADAVMDSWTPREMGSEPNPQPNPMGVVPMVELPNRPLLASEPVSDVSGVIAMQDAINLLWALLFTNADYASLQQRIVTGAEVPKVPILDSNGQKVGERPIDLKKFVTDRILWLENPEAKIDSWPAAQLTAYTEVIEVCVGHIAAQTRTPQHYLVGKMANLSGDALIAAETGLVKRTEEKQLWFGQALREVFQLICLARGEDGKGKALAGGSVLWKDPQSRNLAQLTDSLLKLKQIGFPFEWLALRFGLTPTEVTVLMEMRQREAEQDPVAAMLGAGGSIPPEADPTPQPDPADGGVP
ncbi:phage portal protein [Streptomyces sp. NPDC057253]|uniref:phage portal protein n=1 Tax=Streptomyces sp. NPDC057253 TaxID=3346069 RepID=UPI00362B866F